MSDTESIASNNEEALPIEYEPQHNSADGLRWRPARVAEDDEWAEAGFVGLEELPADSYDLKKNVDGSFVIKMRSEAPKSASKPANSRLAEATAPTSKRKRKEEERKAAKKEKKRARLAAALVDDVSTSAEAKEEVVPVAPVAAADADVSVVASSEWGSFGLHPLILASIGRLGFARPLPVQRATLTQALVFYKDVVGAAETVSWLELPQLQ
jgi:hypothetical protein